jgi:crotonobetainyl-CoA:carnitine CoA-transferase CaiB-like acyl-CoA transferase
MERPDLPDNPAYRTIADRLANREALIGDLEATFATRPAAEWIDLLLDAGIPAGPIYDYDQALGSDQARARDVVMEIDHPAEGRIRSIGFPVKLSGTPQRVRRPPPRLGEHTDEILAELGFDTEARGRLNSPKAPE